MKFFLVHVLVGLYVSVIQTGGVTIPISQGHTQAFTVSSSSLLREDNDRTPEPSDNSYDGLLSANNSTRMTASILGEMIRGGIDGYRRTVETLGDVRHPGVVAEELEAASKYLKHQADLGSERGINDVSDVTRVLDGFVILNNLFAVIVRPRSGKAPVVVTVDAIIHPWFSVNEPRNEMSVTITVVQNWTDERLAYKKMLVHPDKFEYVTLTNYMNIVDIWLPDNAILNEKRSLRNEVNPVRITPVGSVSREQRMSVTVNCPLYNDNFPFDSPKCSVDLSSFSWNANQVQYKWAREIPRQNLSLESNGFRVKSIRRLERLFSGNRAGLSLEFQLERNLVPFVAKIYMPLGCFCLIAIAGLMRSVGAEIGAGLSYFVFGLMSIFMAISFNGPHFNWGYARTKLDAYYIICVFTVIVTGIVNIIRLKAPKSPTSSQESYEMHADQPPKNTRNGRSSNHLWRDSDNFVDDEDDDLGSSVHQIDGGSSRCMERFKNFLRRSRTSFMVACLRINDFAVSIVLGLFITWNFYYWARNG